MHITHTTTATCMYNTTTVVISKTQSWASITTSPPSYSEKLCASESNVYTFICDIRGAYISWNFGNADHNIQATYFGGGNDPKREYHGRTDDYEYHFALLFSEQLPDNNFTMRSSLTIHPYNLTQFPVTCSTHHGQNVDAKSKSYSVAGQ